MDPVVSVEYKDHPRNIDTNPPYLFRKYPNGHKSPIICTACKTQTNNPKDQLQAVNPMIGMNGKTVYLCLGHNNYTYYPDEDR